MQAFCGASNGAVSFLQSSSALRSEQRSDEEKETENNSIPVEEPSAPGYKTRRVL